MEGEMNKVHRGDWKHHWLFYCVGIVLSLFLLAEALSVFKQLPYIGRNVASQDTISVSGEGKVFAAPDIATFSFTVQDRNLVVSKAQDTVNASVSDILAYLKKNGVADTDIQTQNYSISPHYEYQNSVCSPAYNGASPVSSVAYCPPGKSTLTGYDVIETVQVKVRKLADAGKLVAGIGELGATQISGLTFTIDDETTVQREARQKAIADAKTKAQELAQDLGVTLVRIINFSESGPYPVYYAKSAAVGMGGAATPEAASLPTGENQYTSNVNITYEIR